MDLSANAVQTKHEMSENDLRHAQQRSCRDGHSKYTSKCMFAKENDSITLMKHGGTYIKEVLSRGDPADSKLAVHVTVELVLGDGAEGPGQRTHPLHESEEGLHMILQANDMQRT